jgi:hypothetical protein
MNNRFELQVAWAMILHIMVALAVVEGHSSAFLSRPMSGSSRMRWFRARSSGSWNTSQHTGLT